MKPKIFLCGFMGSGKTTIGRLLAEEIQYEFADTNLMIEEQQNRTVVDVFIAEGEDFFREQESQVIRKLIKESNPMVIALGSGSMMDVNNLKVVLDAGLLIQLHCEWSIIRERLRNINTNRLLNAEYPETTWEEHKCNYRWAGYTVDVSGKSLVQIIDELKPCVKNIKKLIAAQIMIE
jgi:shikimate kinase